MEKCKKYPISINSISENNLFRSTHITRLNTRVNLQKQYNFKRNESPQVRENVIADFDFEFPF